MTQLSSAPAINEPNVLWHLAHARLAPSMIIPPGGHGEKVRNANLTEGELHRETVLEAVRLARFPEKPSRLAACFAFDSIETARLYQRLYFPHGVLHEVRAMAIKVHVGNFMALEPVPRRPENHEQMATRYWQNDLNITLEEYPGVWLRELVVAGPLVVVRSVD